MDKETKLAIICFGILPFVGGGIVGYFMGLTSYKLFLYAILHPIIFLVIIYLAVTSAERQFKRDFPDLAQKGAYNRNLTK